MPYPPSVPLIPPLSTAPIPESPNAASPVEKGSLAKILLNALNVIVLPQNLQKKGYEFISDLLAVAHRHFEHRIKGSPRPPEPYHDQATITGAPPSSTQIIGKKKSETLKRVRQNSQMLSKTLLRKRVFNQRRNHNHNNLRLKHSKLPVV